MQDIYSYYAFISYKHEDEEYAKWLQKRLESYRLPAALQNEGVPKRANPVFRDNTDLTPGRPLRKTIKDKLRDSKYLIVICSKNLAKGSEYVDYEIKSFVDMGRADRIIPVIIDGEPHAENPEDECFCSAIKELPGEILAADSTKDGRNIVALKVIAALFQLDADDLIKRDERRRRRNIIFAAFTTVILSVLAMFATITMFNLSFNANSEKAIKAYYEKDYVSAADYAVKALRVPVKKDEKPEMEAVLRSSVISEELRNTNSQFHKEYEVELFNDGVSLYGESKDGKKVGFTDLDKVWVCDATTGDILGEYHIKDDREQLDEIIDIVLFEKYELEKKTEYIPKNHFEEITKLTDTGVLLSIYNSDKTEIQYSVTIDKSTACLVYNSDESAIAVYRGDIFFDGKIEVYSFDSKFSLRLDKEYSNVSSIKFSPQGGYLFVEYKAEDESVDYGMDVYDLSAKCLVAELSDIQRNGFFESFVFSTVDAQQLYIFNPYKVEKYKFTDKKFNTELFFVLEDDNKDAVPGTKTSDIQFSDDGEKILSHSSRYKDGKSISVYSVFDSVSGKVLFACDFVGISDLIDFTPDLNYAVVAKNSTVRIFDIARNESYEFTANSEITSVGINEDASVAVYTTQAGEIVCINNADGKYSVTSEKNINNENTRLMVKCVYGETAVLEYDDVEYVLDIQKNELEKLLDNFTGNRFEKDGYYIYRSSVIKSERILNCGIFENVLFETEPYFAGSSFVDMETKERRDCDFLYYKWAFIPEKSLAAGIKHNELVQFDSDVEVIKLNESGYEVLYTLTLNRSVYELNFDNTGEYLIVSYENGSEVFEAETGKKLVAVDRVIRIYDGIIYDISSDLVIPDKLPISGIYSLEEFEDIASQLK